MRTHRLGADAREQVAQLSRYVGAGSHGHADEPGGRQDQVRELHGPRQYNHEYVHKDPVAWVQDDGLSGLPGWVTGLGRLGLGLGPPGRGMGRLLHPCRGLVSRVPACALARDGHRLWWRPSRRWWGTMCTQVLLHNLLHAGMHL